MLRLLAKFMLLVFVATAHAQDDYNYEYDEEGEGEYDEDYTPTDIRPNFQATPQVFSVEVGGDITFPCEVQNQGKHVLMFKHIQANGVNRLLYLGDINVKKTKKLMKEGNSFVLSGVKKHHAGQYACRIETIPITQIIHTLHVQYPATVSRVSPEVQQVEKGSSVMLECKAEGNPTAAITWSRTQGHLPSGAQSEEGLSIMLEDVDRHVEGIYICTASNGIGRPSSATMTIEVEYPPEVITEQSIIHTGKDDEAKLMCIVRGRPTPVISWWKDGQPVNPNHHISQHDTLHRHTLTIDEVVEEDFGEYICRAKNDLGEMESILRLTGLPKTPKMTSSPAGGEKNSYTLTWETESYTEIIQYRLQYRTFRGNVTGQPQVNWNVRLFFTDPNNKGSGPIHYMTHPIKDLEAAMDYEATVAVENKFGWSNDSRVFHFYTRKEDPTTTTTTTTTTTMAPESEKMSPVKTEVAIGQSSQASGCGALILNLAAMILIMVAHLL